MIGKENETMVLKFKKNKYLKEGLGSYMKHQGPRGTSPGQGPKKQTLGASSISTPKGISQRKIQGVELFTFNFQAWQQDVIRALKRKQSIYVVASPGAGKTAPVAYWWADDVLGVNPGMHSPNPTQLINLAKNLTRLFTNPASFPKILYLCPVRQLVYNIQKEFREYFSQVITHNFRMVQMMMDDDDPSKRVLYEEMIDGLLNALPPNRTGNTVRLLNQRRKMLYGNYRRESNLNQSRAEKIAKDIQILDEQIYSVLAEQIRTFIDRRLLHIKTMIDTAPRIDHNPLVTVAVYQSGLNVFKKIAKDNLRAVIFDEAHTIQATDNTAEQADQITKNVYPIVKKLGKIKAQSIFLSGTVNPAAAVNLCTFFNMCYRTNIKRISSATRNPSEISVIPMDELSKESKLAQILTNPKEEGNVIVLFSKRKINQVVDAALRQTKGTRRTAQQIDRGDLQSAKRPSMSVNLDDYDTQKPSLNIDFAKAQESLISQINRLPGAEDISDPRLLDCVLAGFGYIYRQDDSGKSDAHNQRLGRDQQIVADLFSQGKIKSIIATDSIGIGVNMKVKNMFVPSVSKFTGSGFENLAVSDASQLYNRVGRMAYQVSSIFTPEANMSEILKAISASNEKYEERQTVISKFDKKMCLFTSHNDKLWSAAMSRFTIK